MVIVVYGYTHNLAFTKELLVRKLMNEDIKFSIGEYFVETNKNRYLFKRDDNTSTIGLKYDKKVSGEELVKELDNDSWLNHYER